MPDSPPPGSSAVKSPSSSCKRLTKRATHGTKHQVLGQKRNFSLTRDKRHSSFCLDYLRLHIRRSVPQLSQEVEHQIIHSGGFSNIHQIGILSSYQTMYRSSAPQLIKGITHQAVLDCMKKFYRVCASRNHIRLLGVLSLVVSSGCLGGLHALGCQSRASRTDWLGRYDMANSWATLRVWQSHQETKISQDICKIQEEVWWWWWWRGKGDKRKESEEGGGVKNKMESLLICLFINVPFRLR